MASTGETGERRNGLSSKALLAEKGAADTHSLETASWRRCPREGSPGAPAGTGVQPGGQTAAPGLRPLRAARLGPVGVSKEQAFAAHWPPGVLLVEKEENSRGCWRHLETIG